ncbi:SAM-dependent methyltransferase [Gordoniibacillus kamchatkensis]|uniref:SAM-dependent methyltransferase n=1 Tax=Gordoniibacillus kamchatkensis TaxID=1590651 RepID=A0ABR5AF27_9BACL|nr:class I SAM-dependent methyltransferase [Paenibacillus sp. VKM B-2647]KIL39502.1 SAM-dependent methyltransferase [Paenibacillus sp. VKM B-2647]
MIVTTSYEPTAELAREAREAAAALGAAYAPRGRSSLSQLLAKHGESELLLVAKGGLQLIRGGEPPLFFHPSMAMIRLKRLQRGESDPLLAASRLAPGDTVLDCTAGLAADAIVFAYGAGESGSVTALESEPVIALLVASGLASYELGDADLTAALRRVRVLRTDHLAYLREQPARSVDVVYFDPMFRRPIEASASLSPLRELANASPLAAEAIAEARRVARKTIVLKEQKDSAEFARLGFVKVIPTARKLAYGVIEL